MSLAERRARLFAEMMDAEVEERTCRFTGNRFWEVETPLGEASFYEHEGDLVPFFPRHGMVCVSLKFDWSAEYTLRTVLEQLPDKEIKE